MTMAVCSRCGSEKFGAWVPCRTCGFSPTTAEEKAKAIALSDHYLSAEDLRRVSERIAAGEDVKIAGEGFEDLVRVAEETDSDLKGCRTAFWVVVSLVCVLAIGGALLYVYR